MTTPNTYLSRIGLLGFALILGTFVSIGSVAAGEQGEQFQITRGGGIEVSARLDNREAVSSGTADRITFSLALDTHSVNLFAIDLEQSAELYLDGERLPLSDIEWKGDREDSHHRYGWLSVGVPLLQATENVGGTLELRLRNVGRSDRAFEWTL